MIARAGSLAAAAFVCSISSPGMAQSYPERPIRLILAVAAGGGQDTVARAMTPKLSTLLGANIIIDNRPGGGGNIGVGVARQASPDGYTLLMISSSNVIQPIVHGSPYDLQRDFAPVAQLVNQPYLLAVTPSLPVKSVADLISYARANAGKMNYGSAGSGSLTHLAAELFRDQARFDAVHVPYKGTGPVYPDLIAGRLQFAFATIVSAQPHVRNNRLRALAVSSAKRAQAAPDVPTVAEAGLPGYAVTQWYGVLAPARTPRGAVATLNKAFVGAIEDPELGKHLASDGAEAAPSSPQEFTAHIKAEHSRWSRIIERAGLRKAE